MPTIGHQSHVDDHCPAAQPVVTLSTYRDGPAHYPAAAQPAGLKITVNPEELRERGVPAGGSLLQHLLQPLDLDLGRHTVCRLPGARQVGHSFSNFMLQSPQYSWPHTEHIERFQAERAPADGGGGEGVM